MAVGANETVVPTSELQKSMRRIKQLQGALGRKTLAIEIPKGAVDFVKVKNVDCAHASIARGRAVRAFCGVLGV